jgi:ribonucleoside-diphosphate reductase beta chain
MSAPILHGFTQKRFNDSLTSIGFAAPFKVAPTIIEKTRWMEEEAFGNNVVDFFHKRPVDYAKKNRVFSAQDLF